MFRILVADDNPADVSLLQEVLKTLLRPYHLDWVKDGSEALDFLYGRGAHAAAPRPNLILMDMNMPRVSGWEALVAMKSDPGLSILPVIILSGSTLSADVRKSYRAHANCYVQKPASLERAERLVRAIEAFWMDFAVLPSYENNGIGASHTSVPSYGNPSTDDDSHGRSIARMTAEARSRGMFTNESRANQAVSSQNPDCEENRLLLDEFGVAVEVLLKLHEQQFLATVQGDIECNRFDLLIHMANEKKQLAKYAYIRHLESHGCAEFNALNKTRA